MVAPSCSRGLPRKCQKGRVHSGCVSFPCISSGGAEGLFSCPSTFQAHCPVWGLGTGSFGHQMESDSRCLRRPSSSPPAGLSVSSLTDLLPGPGMRPSLIVPSCHTGALGLVMGYPFDTVKVSLTSTGEVDGHT